MSGLRRLRNSFEQSPAHLLSGFPQLGISTSNVVPTPAVSDLQYPTTIETAICGICFEEILPETRLSRPVTSTCQHDHNSICLTCLQQSITAQTNSKSWDTITCPHIGCTAILGYHGMQNSASADLFARYDHYVNRKALESLPNYQPCASSTCQDGGFVDDNDSFMTCTSCNTVTCISCKTKYHPGTTHAENLEAIKQKQEQAQSQRTKEKKREEQKTAKEVKKMGAKPCPGRNCGILILKTTGCDHMIYK